MGIPLGDLVDPENYYHESQNSLYSWFVDLGEGCAGRSALNTRPRLLGQYSCSPSFARLGLLANHQIQHTLSSLTFELAGFAESIQLYAVDSTA